MKISKLMPIMLLTMTVVFISCSKGPDKLIAKTWKVTDVIAKGTLNKADFLTVKTDLLKVEMTFKDNKYTMTSNGATIETGTYSVQDGKVVVKTEQGMNMDATVQKDRLVLETPDFSTILQPK
jgi:uncharacterized protein affecting Mg2+/Co2+ transport